MGELTSLPLEPLKNRHWGYYYPDELFDIELERALQAELKKFKHSPIQIRGKQLSWNNTPSDGKDGATSNALWIRETKNIYDLHKHGHGDMPATVTNGIDFIAGDNPAALLGYAFVLTNQEKESGLYKHYITCFRREGDRLVKAEFETKPSESSTSGIVERMSESQT